MNDDNLPEPILGWEDRLSTYHSIYNIKHTLHGKQYEVEILFLNDLHYRERPGILKWCPSNEIIKHLNKCDAIVVTSRSWAFDKQIIDTLCHSNAKKVAIIFTTHEEALYPWLDFIDFDVRAHQKDIKFYYFHNED